MSISISKARELQHRVRVEPKSAPAIVGDLIADVNRLSMATLGDLPLYNPPVAPLRPVETNEQREQRLLDELDSVRKDKELVAVFAKAEAAKKVRLDALDRATAISQATTDVLQSIRGQINYNTGDVLSRDTWWKFRRELTPVVAAHGFKLVNVGTKAKPRAALAEV